MRASSGRVSRVLVLGATGAQGGSVARRLLDAGFMVRALTRHPAGTAALRLQAAGAEIVRGDLLERASLRAALRGCDRVFGSTVCWRGDASEETHGRNLINVVSGAEVDHLVFSTMLPQLEAYARSLEVPATFLRIPPLPLSDEAAAALSAAVLNIFCAPTEYLGRAVEIAALLNPDALLS